MAPTAAMLIASVVKGGEGRVQGWIAVADLPTLAGGGHFPDDAAQTQPSPQMARLSFTIGLARPIDHLDRLNAFFLRLSYLAL
jgi:hypothetical protein